LRYAIPPPRKGDSTGGWGGKQCKEPGKLELVAVEGHSSTDLERPKSENLAANWVEKCMLDAGTKENNNLNESKVKECSSLNETKFKECSRFNETKLIECNSLNKKKVKSMPVRIVIGTKEGLFVAAKVQNQTQAFLVDTGANATIFEYFLCQKSKNLMQKLFQWRLT